MATSKNQTQDNSATRNEIVKNVQLDWCKLDPKKPANPFGEDRWEIRAGVPKKRKAELEKFGKVKVQEDGLITINFVKNAVKKDGSPAAAVKVVDTKGNSIDPTTIGNGSIGNVRLMLRDWEQKGPKGNVIKRGTKVTLSAIQVTDYKKYEPKSPEGMVDFEYEDSDEGASDDDTPNF